jgi:hypothetical protein
MMQSRSLLQRFKDKYSKKFHDDGSNDCMTNESRVPYCASPPASSVSSVPPQPSGDVIGSKKFHSGMSFPLQLYNFIISISTGNHYLDNKYSKQHHGGVGRVRTLLLGSLLCSMLSLVVFHPPCRRRKARYSPVCVMARELGLSEPLPGGVVPIKSQLDANLPRQERSRLFLGILSAGSEPEELERRHAIRSRLLNDPINEKRNVTCSLEEYVRHPKPNKYCKIVYTFVLGGNDQGDHLAFNKTYPSKLPFSETSYFAERFNGHNHDHLSDFIGADISFGERDVTFLNVRDVNNVRKVWAWYDYATKVKMEKGRRFDYVGVMMDTEGALFRTRRSYRVLDPVTFLTQNSILRPRMVTPSTYAGLERSKSDCEGVDAVWACPRLQPDAYMSGDLMVLSKDLVDYCLTHNNLIQLNGVYPQDRPDIALANLLSLHPKGVNGTHLSGVVDAVIEVNGSPPVSSHRGVDHSSYKLGEAYMVFDGDD